MEYSIPRGTYDILPEAAPAWQALRTRFTELALAFGYHEITTPIFEQAGLFERSSGESSDVVQKEMYRFTDRKDRVFALRPEGTAPVVRSYVENRLDLKSENKLCYWGPMFRYDRPQAGRFRQFYQYGIEFIGSDYPYWDAEVISFLWVFFQSLGLKKLRLELNSVGCPDCAASYENALRDYYRPHLEQLCPDCVKRFELKPRRLLDCKVPSCKVFAKDAPSQLEYLDEKCSDHFEQVKAFLEQMKVPYTINPGIVRGLDYYTNTAFELIYEGIGAQNSLAGGGRYNGLIEQVGGKSTPAIGFAGGIERLLLALEAEGISLAEAPRPDIYLIAMGIEARDYILPYINLWRVSGISVAFDPEKTSFKALLKAANGSQAKFAVIIGEDEVRCGKVMLKNLQTGEQKAIKPDQLVVSDTNPTR